jgi:hypothetical protein
MKTRQGTQRKGKRCAHPHEESVTKMPHKGALGKKTSQMSDKEKFWLRLKFFKTPRQGWVPKGKAR